MKKAILAGAAATAMAGTGVLATAGVSSAADASPAPKADYGGQCGDGYGVVNQAGIGDDGTVFLTYNRSTEKNCVVTVRNSTGDPMEMSASVQRLGDDPSEKVVDEGEFTVRAGPVYVPAKGTCVAWGGKIGEQEYSNPGSNCGAKTGP